MVLGPKGSVSSVDTFAFDFQKHNLCMSRRPTRQSRFHHTQRMIKITIQIPTMTIGGTGVFFPVCVCVVSSTNTSRCCKSSGRYLGVI